MLLTFGENSVTLLFNVKLDAPRLDWLACGQPATALRRRLAAAACPALQPAEWIVPTQRYTIAVR